MGMGIVSNKDFAKEREAVGLPKEKEPTNDPMDQLDESVIIDVPSTHGSNTHEGRIERGRGDGSTEVPNSLRQLIGTESAINGRSAALELAESFGISPSSVSAYAKGATSTTSYDERPNGSAITNAKLAVSKKARKKLMLAINYITEEKLANAKVGELSHVAKNMSGIMKDMTDTNDERDGRNDGPTFVFYSPNIREEKHFDIVKTKE